jgi:hypothetical protein
MKNSFLLFCLMLMGTTVFAQDRCGHVAYMNYLYSKNPDLKKQHDALNKMVNQRLKSTKSLKATKSQATPEVIYEIPVVVHVIHNVASGAISGNNISDAQVRSQIDILNQDYSRNNADTSDTYPIFKSVGADTKIHFCLATLDPNGDETNGIIRVYNRKASFEINDDALLKGLSYWDDGKYLNIWVCNLTDPVLGYAQFPSYTSLVGLDQNGGADATDGVVIDYKAFGNIGTATSPYNLGRTATHEIGHWLGLIHIWGDTDCGDDYIADTPTQRTNTSGNTCTVDYSNCTGPMTQNMNQNYLDYSADACMNIFTYGQKDRMRTVMSVSPKRAALFNAISCCPLENKETIPYSIRFEDENYLSEQWRTINYDSTSSYTKKWERVSPGAYAQSDFSFMIESDSIYTSANTKYWDAFVSPYIDLSPAQKPRLDFDLAYAYGTLNYNTDSLVVSYSEGCKNIWSSFTTIYGSDLVSTERRTDNFQPDANEWKKVTIELQPLYGKKYIKFRIAAYSKGINKLYIDNINFYKVADNVSLNLYPIPVTDELNVEVVYTGYKDVVIEGFNTMGKRIFHLEKSNTTSFIAPVDISAIEPGIYLFKITTGSNKITKRFVIE